MGSEGEAPSPARVRPSGTGLLGTAARPAGTLAQCEASRSEPVRRVISATRRPFAIIRKLIESATGDRRLWLEEYGKREVRRTAGNDPLHAPEVSVRALVHTAGRQRAIRQRM